METSPTTLLTLRVRHDQDVVAARQRAGDLSSLLGFDSGEQTRIATAVSEIVRNAVRYAGSGEAVFAIDRESKPQALVITVTDRGPGIPHLDRVLSGRYKSSTGMGLGIAGARRLMDGFDIESNDRGTRVTLRKTLSPRAHVVTEARVESILRTVRSRQPSGIAEEFQRQNQELLRALDELQTRQEELVRLNRELEDTNRGVVALYAELDEKADHLRRADELKSRFLSNMTHEFRTPVNSILGLCNLILEDRQREGRDAEQEVIYIRKAAEQLGELVNDLLDLAKVEAGKTTVRPGPMDVTKLFGALRGMLRPLLLNQSVALVFDAAERLPIVTTDEPKVSQILRNLISNALKFTERGEVRVSAILGDDGKTIAFSVADTGIGIAPADQERIFEEFTQVEHRLQRGVRGTGLGLPLSKRLAELLGGTLSLQSEPGVGSTFTVTLPVHYEVEDEVPEFTWTPDPDMRPVLVVEDKADEQLIYEKLLKGTGFQIYPAVTVDQAEHALTVMRPTLVILDIRLRGVESWDFLLRLRRDPRTQDVPVIVVTSLDERDRAFALGAQACFLKPVSRRALLDTMAALTSGPSGEPTRVLLIEDEEISRYIIAQALDGACHLTACADAVEGLRHAKEQAADVILLDLMLPGMTGWEALDALRDDVATHDLPVIIVTASALDPAGRAQLLLHARDVIAKGDLTRERLLGAIAAAVHR